jgi:branched-chain amino acid aminotransferase
VRAWPGGTGDCKVGGNYAPTIAPQEEAAQRGFNQVLWLFGEEQEVTEVGTMNLFFHMRAEDGVNELVTAPLNDIVLPGVTRDSIIHLARQNNIRVSERRQTMKQLIAAANAGRVLEAFGAGTACVVSPVKEINFQGTAYEIPLGKEPGSKSGPMAQFFWDELTKIQVHKYQRNSHAFTGVTFTSYCDEKFRMNTCLNCRTEACDTCAVRRSSQPPLERQGVGRDTRYDAATVSRGST